MSTSQKILVTGGTGFIGGRLVERLILERGDDVSALVRNLAHASRLARFRLKMVPGDVADDDVADRATQGMDVVFHCAHDFTNPQRNIDAAVKLAEACLKNGVKRLVHLSTFSVYDPLPDGDVDESSRCEPCGFEYTDNKIEIERKLASFAKERGLPVVMLQPTIVYGPYSNAWTDYPIKQVKSGKVVLPDDGSGFCNAVYIDDVVTAMLLAAEREGIAGERFLISGKDPVPWRDFFGEYERMSGRKSVSFMKTDKIAKEAHIAGFRKKLTMYARDPYKLTIDFPPIRAAKNIAKSMIGQGVWSKARGRLPEKLYVPDESKLAMYKAKAHVRIDKAVQRLGYHPAFDLRRGMEMTEKYARWANLL